MFKVEKSQHDLLRPLVPDAGRLGRRGLEGSKLKTLVPHHKMLGFQGEKNQGGGRARVLLWASLGWEGSERNTQGHTAETLPTFAGGAFLSQESRQ